MGARRTGLAVGDDETGVVAPHAVLDVSGPQLLRALLDAVEDVGPEAIVVGLPLNMDGTEGAAAKAARRVGEALGAGTDRSVYYQDERLTSFAAEEALSGSGRTHRRKRALRDALAAAEILRDFLRARRGGT